MQNLGEAAAIATALCWTGSSLFFGYAGRRVGSLAVNQFRILVAVPVLLLAGTPGFRLRWIWYISAVAIFVQLGMSLALLKREFRRRLAGFTAAS